MIIRIPETLAKEIENPQDFGIDLSDLEYARYAEVDLSKFSLAKVKALQAACEAKKSIKTTSVVLKDIATWIAALDNPKSQRARTLRHLSSLLTEYLGRVEGHRVYERFDDADSVWLPYVVTKIEYHPPEQTRSGGYSPASVSVSLVYEKFGNYAGSGISFQEKDFREMTVEESLARKGFFAETTELRKNYLAELKLYHNTAPKIGKQYLAVGVGSNQLPEEGWGGRTKFYFSSGDGQNRVVIDSFDEEQRDVGRERNQNLGEEFWAEQAHKTSNRSGSGGNELLEDELKTRSDGSNYVKRRGMDVEDVGEELPFIEVPVHPLCVVFDLQRHLRLSIHVNYLTEYQYDENLSEKLVLSSEVKSLVKLLVEKESSFKDIIVGKSGGRVILLSGDAGVGKTLTAEVFAESQKKPLYSVQTSQLGITPEELEKNLKAVLKRASKWDAVLLLDEADVYVHERGNDLKQNAIVGVFLRVLEYHAPILFMTTNRADIVDDAITSRCIVRIDYQYPTPEEQKQIWKVLSETSKIKIEVSVINAFVASHPKLSGRDVKNLLKLGQLISSAKKTSIDLAVLEYALKFKPTVSAEGV